MKSNQAMVAQNARKDLKTEFPNTKFSVTSDSGSMTSSVNVSWTDGPTAEMVDSIIKKYNYEHSGKIEGLPQVRFVFSNRDMSEETRHDIIKKHNETFCEAGQIKDEQAYNEDAQCWNSQLIYRIFNKLNLYEDL